MGTFEEVNLRFYVKRIDGDEIKRGVVFINETVPFKTVKVDKEKAVADINVLVKRLYRITKMLAPFMPQTAATIQKHIEEHTMPSPIFARL